jgi:CPA1 family monovalent cation:H+ antiporter
LVLIGLALGLLISGLIGWIDDALVETTLTVVLAFGAYVVAESQGTGGVLAVVATGLVSGNAGPRRMSPTARLLVFNSWETGAFLASSFPSC